MKLTREDLAMMLNEMNNWQAEYIEVTPNYDDYLGCTEDIDFDLVTIAKTSGDGVEDILVKLSNAFCECFQMNFTQGFVEQNLGFVYLVEN